MARPRQAHSWDFSCFFRLGREAPYFRSGAQPSGVVTPKKQSPEFFWMTWFWKTGVMTTPADAREAAAAMRRAKAVFMLDGWRLRMMGRRGADVNLRAFQTSCCRSGPRVVKAKGGITSKKEIRTERRAGSEGGSLITRRRTGTKACI